MQSWFLLYVQEGVFIRIDAERPIQPKFGATRINLKDRDLFRPDQVAGNLANSVESIGLVALAA